HFGDIGHPHRCAGVTGMRLLYGVHGQKSNRIGKFAAGGHGNLLLLKGTRIVLYSGAASKYRGAPSAISADRGLTGVKSGISAETRCSAQFDDIVPPYVQSRSIRLDAV